MTARPKSEPRPGVDLTPEHLMRLRTRLRSGPGAQASGAQSIGGRIVQRAGQGQEVYDLRAFVEGDDLRHLDHRATARKGRPHIKRFHEERNSKLLLVLDLRPVMFFGLRRAFYAYAAAEILCLKGWAHLAGFGHVGLYAFTNETEVFLRPKPRDQAMMRVIGEICALYRKGMADAGAERGSMRLSDRLAEMIRLGERGSTVMLASSFDHAGADNAQVLDQLRHRYQLKTYLIGTQALAGLPPGRYPVFNEQSGRMDVAGFDAPEVPPYLNRQRSDHVVDAAVDPVDLITGGHL